MKKWGILGLVGALSACANQASTQPTRGYCQSGLGLLRGKGRAFGYRQHTNRASGHVHLAGWHGDRGVGADAP